jgi:hypothetical protein
VDSEINFLWESFITATGKDYISVRWTGFFQPQFSEVYTFTIEVNDGARLWVDNELLFDSFESTTPENSIYSTYTGVTTSLIADRLYDIKLEYRENTGKAIARLYWSSASQPLEIVPSSALYHADTPIVSSPFTVKPFAVEPTVPTDLSLSVFDEQALTLSWREPANDGGASIISYTVEWWTAWGTKTKQTVIVTPTSGTFTLGLTGSSYTTPPLKHKLLENN